MTDYSSDSSTDSNESIASHAAEAFSELDEDMRLRALEQSIDVVMKNHDNTLKYPFYLFKDPFVAIDRGLTRLATNEDVVRRLNDDEKEIWQALWQDEYTNVESTSFLDTDALDALIEVAFRAAGGTRQDIGIVYSVVCSLLDARIKRSSPRAPCII